MDIMLVEDPQSVSGRRGGARECHAAAGGGEEEGVGVGEGDPSATHAQHSAAADGRCDRVDGGSFSLQASRRDDSSEGAHAGLESLDAVG